MTDPFGSLAKGQEAPYTSILPLEPDMDLSAPTRAIWCNALQIVATVIMADGSEASRIVFLKGENRFRVSRIVDIDDWDEAVTNFDPPALLGLF